jgi:hypothetical protein
LSTALPPGQDPVADHTWCCEHPEPWHYFVSDNEARLLSGLSRVYRVDPVEAAWSLHIAAWAATEAAIPVLTEVATSLALPPKSRLVAQEVLFALDPEGAGARPLSETIAQARDQGAGALIELLGATHGAESRRAIADCLAELAGGRLPVGERLAAVTELASERHPRAAELVDRWLLGPGRLALDDEQRAHALLACASSGEDWGLDCASHILADDPGRVGLYEIYEATKSLALRPPPALTDAARHALLGAIRGLAVWNEQSPHRADYQLVIQAALLGPAAARAVHRASRPGGFLGLFGRSNRRPHLRAVAEAAGYIGDSAVPLLGRLVRETRLMVRREAARSLWRLDSAPASEALLDFLGTAVLPGKIGLDVEGVEAVRLALDALVRDPVPSAPPVLAALLVAPHLQIDDLAERTAVTLARLGDARCELPHPQAKIPRIAHAALTPLSVTRREALADYVRDAARWLEQSRGVDLAIPEGDLGHRSRVHLQRRIRAAVA